MEQLRYVILDDEPIAHRIIEGYCENFSFLSKAGNFYNGFEALEFFRTSKADLIFLDINMPKLTGFELLKLLPHPPKVIVTSAHQEFALQGYELDISDYLLKPFSLDRFIKA
ncbi:MAG: response regulator, partial [Algoriphagus sp.]